MTTKCERCPLRARTGFTNLRADETDFVGKFKVGELKVDAGAPVLQEGAASPHFFTVLDGAAARTKTLSDGRRQITNFVFPGDLIGLQASLLGEMRHGVEAATTMTLCVFSRERLWELFRLHPGRAYDVTWLAASETRTLSENLLTVGRRTARERLAFLLEFVMQRAVASGFAETQSRTRFPFRQQDLADATGLSLVHTNKMLQSLRAAGFVSLTDGVLEIRDRDGLRNAADFSEAEDLDLPRPLL